jgi:hypothetical protein
MSANLGLERCQSFINCQLQPSARPEPASSSDAPQAITISRQAGAGGHAVAEELVRFFDTQAPQGESGWTVFDRNLLEKVLEDHNLPKRLARFMPEDRTSEIADTIDELFGLHPLRQTLVRQTADTILRLAELGRVIIIGRGANIITRRLSSAFHVRLVGSLEHRAEHMARLNGLRYNDALKSVDSLDRGRQRYMKKYFACEIDDPLLYHLVINTDLLTGQEAATLIGTTASRLLKTPPQALKAA